MKDEEMAEEYAQNLEKELMKEYEEHSEYGQTPYLATIPTPHVKQAFLAGLKADRPRWHDLRKTPNDLPNDTTSLYLVRVYSWDFGLSHLYKKYTTYIPTVCEWNGEYFKGLDEKAYSNARNIKNCIAWKEIVLLKEIE
jgi:hypothetical protein